MTQISISPLYHNGANNDSEFKSYPSSYLHEHSVSPQKKPPLMESILNLKLPNADENIAFNQNFLYRREKDQDPSTFTFPNDTKRDHSQVPGHEGTTNLDKPGDHEGLSPSSKLRHRKRHGPLMLPESEHQQQLQVPTNMEEIKSPTVESYSPHNSKEFNELLVPMLKRFIMKLRNGSFFRSIAQLKTDHYQLIDDASYFQEKEISESRFTLIFRIFFQGKLAKRYLSFNTWDPYKSFRTIWDALHLLAIMGIFFFVPLELAFLGGQFLILKDLIYILCLLFFAVDVLVNLNTGYYSDGLLVKLRPKIFRHYIYHGLFVSDISAIFALIIGNYLFSDKGTSYFAVLVFGKISRMKWIYIKLTSQFKLQTSFKGYMDLFNLLMTSLLVLHLICCFWLMLALLSLEYYGGDAQTWLKLHSLDQQTWYIQYLYSFYWSVVTMMTVGYGDFVPQNSIETLYTTITIIFGCGVYGYYLNTVGILLQDIHKEENKYNSNLRVINMFMDRKAIDNELQMRVREYLRFIWNEEKTQNDEEEAKIINSLNNYLKEELLLKAYGNILKQFPMFYANFSEKSLRKMVIFMKEVRFIPGDGIYFEHEIDDSAIYFINKGAVELFLSRNDQTMPHKLRKLGPGECFGELGFFTGQPREASARSLEFISVFMIKRQDFMEIIRENDDDYQKFCMIRDQIMLYNNCQSLRLRCSACGSLDHLVKTCGLLHFVPDVEKIIKRYEFYKDQPRKPNPRGLRKKPNGRKLFKRMQKTAMRIQKELKRDKENEKNEFLRRKLLNGEYDTIYFNSEISLSSEVEEDDSLEDDGESSESQGETNTYHTETNRIQSKVGTSFENLMKQSSDTNMEKMFRRKITKERSLDAKIEKNIEKIERNNEKYEKTIEKYEKHNEKYEKSSEKHEKYDKASNFDKISNNLEKSSEKNDPTPIKASENEIRDRIREQYAGVSVNDQPDFTIIRPSEFQAKSEDNLVINALEVAAQGADMMKRYSVMEEFMMNRQTAGFKSNLPSRASLLQNTNTTNQLIQRNSMAEEVSKQSDHSKRPQMANPKKKISAQFNDKRMDTSGLLAVKEQIIKDKERSMGSKTSFHESRVMTRTKTRQKTKKNGGNSITNDPHPHSNIVHSNIVHSKTSVNNKEMTQTTVQQDLLIFFDQVASFKNYFVEGNVAAVLDIYDKKRRKLMFLNEMKLLTPELSSNIVLRKGTHIVPGGGFNSTEFKDRDDRIRMWAKYTFYPHKMHELSNGLQRRITSPLRRRRREASPKVTDRKKSVFGALGLSMKSKKSNFFGEVLVNNGAKKGFTDFVFDIIKDPKFQKWKKNKKGGKRVSNFFREK